MNYVIDRGKQRQEKNIWWGDYPTMGLTADGKFRAGKNLNHYYSSMDDYDQKGMRELENELNELRSLRELEKKENLKRW